MSHYGGTITAVGRNLITSLLVGETIEFTRVVVGSGAVPGGVELIDMESLVKPVADGTSTPPIMRDREVHFTVEYRNDLNGGLEEGFWLSEFGVFAKTKTMPEVLLYYATLGNSPQPVHAYKDNRVDIRRYPVTIALEIDADVKVSYNPGAFVTGEEVKELVKSCIASLHQIITIPASGWVEDAQPTADNKYLCDVEIEGSRNDMVPSGSAMRGSFGVAARAGVVPGCDTFDGFVRFYAKRIPRRDIEACVHLYAIGNNEGSSGDGPEVDVPGGYEIAGTNDTHDMLSGVFGK